MDLTSIALQVVTSGALTAFLLYWLKQRLETSIRQEADRALRSFQEQQRRYVSLLSERESAYRVLSKPLINLRRYCAARENELAPSSEFAPTSESLHPEEKHSLLEHWGIIERSSEEFELFFTDEIEQSLNSLHNTMCLGFNYELANFGWDRTDNELNGAPLYATIEAECNLVIAALHNGLELPISDPSR